MKIGIHQTKGSFSDRWVACCEAKKIAWKPVDCYRSNIVQQLSGCDALMWHFHHASPKDCLFAKQSLYSVKASGKQAFPDFNTAWHFEDKIGQKYLLEAIGASLVSSYVFYSFKKRLNGRIMPLSKKFSNREKEQVLPILEWSKRSVMR